MGRAHQNMIAARLRKRNEAAGVNTAAAQLRVKSSQAQNTPNSAVSNGDQVNTISKVNNIPKVNNAVVVTATTVPPALTRCSINLLEMPAYQRKALAHGPTIKFVQGKTFLISLPVGLFFSASSNAAQLVSSNCATEIKLPTSLSTSSLQLLLEWLKSCTMKNTIFAPRVQRDLVDALNIYHSAEALGLLPYIDNTLKYQKHRLFNTTPSEGVISTIENSALNGGCDDHFLAILTERIAYIIRKDLLHADEKDDYMTMIANHRTVYAVVQRINGPWMKRRAAEARRLELEAKAAAAKVRNEKAMERAAAEKVMRKEAANKLYHDDMEARGALLEKLKGQSKVLTLTKDEMELAERLRGYGDVQIGKWM
ncbi:uncharacterized protein EI97DRAFT_439289 [Westerdykella ornata]|uniref:BTB domain-containing protein n=1 Tax=Westerdykella ornata TaxID=318751 RepID=A0A6A6JYX2_WESOR|nr:uncharacterized protein EI97DRAFT_439289 [Westerdykella ornata]KAF2280239.1 hypothetical protein EI97DRAFT_439289 [Westerdykella ornata]